MKPRIFIGQPDDKLRWFLEEQLRADGYEVFGSRNGRETLVALGAMRRLPFCLPDVIILDLHMASHSGIAILGALRDAGWTTPVVLIAPKSTHAAALHGGAAAAFDIPFDMADMRVALRKCWLDALPTAS